MDRQTEGLPDGCQLDTYPWLTEASEPRDPPGMQRYILKGWTDGQTDRRIARWMSA